MVVPKNVASAFIGLRKLLFQNPSPISAIDVLIMINNELDVADKFLSPKALDDFYKAAAAGIIRIKYLAARIKALSKVLDRLWYSLNTEIMQLKDNDPLKTYYRFQGRVFTDFPLEEIKKNEDIQFSEVRQAWLNQAQEQIIFNYEPAEIGPDNDPRAKKLRRDLVANLGLVGFTNYKNLEDLKRNREIKCNYVFVVPDHEKAIMLWIGIVKELYRSLFELVDPSESLNLSRNEIFNLALNKITQLYSEEYSIKGRSIFDQQGHKYPALKPINVFVAAPEYCWAPTVVASKSEGEHNQAGFVMFRDEDIGVAQMTKKSISIWCSSVLKIFFLTEKPDLKAEGALADIVHWSEEFAKQKMTEILSSVWSEGSI